MSTCYTKKTYMLTYRTRTGCRQSLAGRLADMHDCYNGGIINSVQCFCFGRILCNYCISTVVYCVKNAY